MAKKAAGVRGGTVRDRAKALKEKIKSRPGMEKAKAVIQKVRAARDTTAKNSDVKGGKMRKKGSKLMLKSGAGKRVSKCTV